MWKVEYYGAQLKMKDWFLSFSAIPSRVKSRALVLVVRHLYNFRVNLMVLGRHQFRNLDRHDLHRLLLNASTAQLRLITIPCTVPYEGTNTTYSNYTSPFSCQGMQSTHTNIDLQPSPSPYIVHCQCTISTNNVLLS